MRIDSLTDEQKNFNQKIKFFVMINCDEDQIEYTTKELKKIDCVTEVRLLDDVYDILVILESNSENNLKIVLSNKIRMIGTIRSTLTLQSCKELQIVS